MVKNITLLNTKKVLGNVHPDKVFNLSDGSSVKNIKELYDTLRNIEQSVFEDHVSSEKNDFGNWIKDVHKDYKLANSLFSAKNKQECAKAVGNRIYELKRLFEQCKRPEQRKSVQLSETETAAERLEKILTEAVRAKYDVSPPAETIEKKKDRIKRDEPKLSSTKMDDASVGNILMLERSDHKPRIRNEPFRLKENEETEQESAIEKKVKGPTAHELLSEKFVEPEDPCEEMIKLAETKSHARQLMGEVSSIFKGSNVKAFAGDMKKLFSSESAAEENPLEESESPEAFDAPEADDEKKAGTDVEETRASGTCEGKKEKILSHLKRVYK